MMASIAETTERELPYGRWLTDRANQNGADESAAIAFGAVGAVYQLGLKALVVPTFTGRTAALMSAHRPNVPILALSPRADVVRRLSLHWGVISKLNDEPSETLDLLEECSQAAKEAGVVSPGDRIGITAGLPAGKAGGTNLFKVHTVE
jgi:pyruvate kinase